MSVFCNTLAKISVSELKIRSQIIIIIMAMAIGQCPLTSERKLKKKNQVCDDCGGAGFAIFLLEFIFSALVSLWIIHKILYCVAGKPSIGRKVLYLSSIGESKQLKEEKKWAEKANKNRDASNKSNKNQSEKLFRAFFFHRVLGFGRKSPTNEIVCTTLVHDANDRKYCTTTFATCKPFDRCPVTRKTDRWF